MMKKEKNTLGKGLSALISSHLNHNSSSQESTDKMIYVEIDNVIPNINQPRKFFSEFELMELAESIKMHGVLQPLLVTQEGEQYKLIAGERRLKAAKIAEQKLVPIILYDLNDAQSLEIALIENIQRENLNVMEEAFAYKKLMDNYDYTQEQLGIRLNKSRSHVANMLRLLSLPEKVQQRILDNKLSFGHAKLLANAQNAEFLADKIIGNNLSVRDAEKLVKMQNFPIRDIKREPHKVFSKAMPTMAHDKIEKDQELIDIEKLLTTTLNLQVEIIESLEGAKLQISFKTFQELDSLIELLTNR